MIYYEDLSEAEKNEVDELVEEITGATTDACAEQDIAEDDAAYEIMNSVLYGRSESIRHAVRSQMGF